MWLVRNLSAAEGPVLVTALVVLFVVIPAVTVMLAKRRR
jgi:hypothetical protein